MKLLCAFLMVFGLNACAAAPVDKPVLVASAPDGSVTLELYARPCVNTAAKEIMAMVSASAPIPVSKDWKEVLWIGNKDKKNFTGCWVEVPEREAILFTFEDGDVKVFRRGDFQTPANAVIERYMRQNKMIRI